MKITQRLKEKSQNTISSAPLVIGCIGDSVTHGCFEIYPSGENSIDPEYRTGQAYHAKLRQLIETVLPSVSVNIINAGVSGDNAVSAAKRLQRDIISYHPDLCIMCFGLNDVNKGADAVCEYTDALASMFVQLKEADIETIFLTPNMMATRVVAEEKDERIRAVLNFSKHQIDGTFDLYIEKAREVCTEHNIPVCDCYAKWKQLEENGADITRLLSNRINHPTEEMHWLFAYSLFEMIMGF